MNSRVRENDTQRTPFMIGINDAGSVDMEASSRKTTGKSIMFNAAQAEVMQVVQICVQFQKYDTYRILENVPRRPHERFASAFFVV